MNIYLCQQLFPKGRIREFEEKINMIFSEVVKKKDNIRASSLNTTQYQQFYCGHFSLDDDVYEELSTENVYGAVLGILNDFKTTIQTNLSDGNVSEVNFCQAPTETLLNSMSTIFFPDDNVHCLREYGVRLDSDEFTFTSDGKLDHVVAVGRHNQDVRVEGLPLVFVECKNLDWRFYKKSCGNPKARGLCIWQRCRISLQNRWESVRALCTCSCTVAWNGCFFVVH